MEKAVAELSEKKVIRRAFLSTAVLTRRRQVDGFKLHVTHTTRPFITRARMTPEVASHPERVKKDLSQIKALAAILEDEAAALRQLSPMQTHPDHLGPDGPPSDGTQVKPEQPANGHGGIENEREPELRGSDLVEQRVEKILAQQLGEGPEDRLGREYRRVRSNPQMTNCRLIYQHNKEYHFLRSLQSVSKNCPSTPAITVPQSRTM